jgi:hypothetical protein
VLWVAYASLGTITHTLTLTGEYDKANDFKVRLRASTDFAISVVPRWHKLIMEGVNFGWFALWVLSPDWLSRKSDFLGVLR